VLPAGVNKERRWGVVNKQARCQVH